MLTTNNILVDIELIDRHAVIIIKSCMKNSISDNLNNLIYVSLVHTASLMVRYKYIYFGGRKP